MADYFQKMDEDYVKKHFPEGSVFKSVEKTFKKRSWVGIFFFGLFFAAAVYGTIWSVGTAIAEGGGYGIMLGIFCGLIALGCFFVLRLVIKTSRQGVDGYRANSAKASGLPISEIEAFDRQALEGDCFLLKLNNVMKEGLLTEDYLYPGDTAQTVMRVDSLKACCFTDYTYYMSVGGKHKKIHNLAICLIASNGVSVRVDTTEKAGKALMEILKERNGGIDTNDGKVLPEGREFDDYYKRILEKPAL